MPEGIVTKGINHKKLRPLIERVRQRVKKHPTIKKMFEEHGISLDEIDLIPMCFAHIDVSARTDHGIIYFGMKLLDDGDFDNDDHYLVHEITHFLQQTTGNKPTQGADDGEYLDNPAEMEGFQNQSEYISDTRSDEEADKYINRVLDHHDYNGKERKEKRKELLRQALMGSSQIL